jgi:hypothetical protein
MVPETGLAFSKSLLHLRQNEDGLFEQAQQTLRN